MGTATSTPWEEHQVLITREVLRMLIEELAAMYSTVPSIFQRIAMITIIYNNNDNGDNGTDDIHDKSLSKQ